MKKKQPISYEDIRSTVRYNIQSESIDYLSRYKCLTIYPESKGIIYKETEGSSLSIRAETYIINLVKRMDWNYIGAKLPDPKPMNRDLSSV